MRQVLITVLVAAACHRGATTPTEGPAAAPTPEAGFWSWFLAHQGDVAKVQRADEPVANDLARELHKVNADLTFELGAKHSPHELIISADGIQSAFPAVKRLVALAPDVPGWKVIAFRPRHPSYSALELGDGTRLASSDIAFRVLGTHDGKLDVAFYLKPVAVVSPALKQAVFLQLDSVLGEYDVETKLGEIDIEPGATAPTDARPLGDLPGVVDATK